MRRSLIALVLCAAACGGDPAPDAGTGAGRSDVTPPMDAGPRRDAGADAGSDTDAGGADAGGLDCTAPFTPVAKPPASPPFSGTAFVTDDLITDADPTAFRTITYQGQALRMMFDRRTASFNMENAHLFDATYGAGTVVEIQVNPEMTQSEAEAEARRYAEVVGRIPAFLFRDLDTMWIHRGLEPFGGGNRNLLIHTAQGEQYAATGVLEEIFIHEGAHTSLDGEHLRTPRWQEAQAADGVSISDYGRDFPMREDLAETLGPYLAYRFRPERIDASTAAQIEGAVPNRIRYLDCLGLDMSLVP